MYGKSFESMYEGSMVGAGINVFAVWSYIITKCQRSVVEINPKLLAFTLGGSEQDIISALEFLQKPDPESRSKVCEGRRLIKEGQFQYRVVNWKIYDEIKSELERKDYNRRKQQEYRDSKAGLATDEPVSKVVETSKFCKPTLDAVKLCCAKSGLPESDAEWFWNKCEGNGWTNNGKQIKSWTHTLGSWNAAGYMPSQKNKQQNQPQTKSKFPMTPDGDYDFDRMTEKQRSEAVREMNR